MKEYIVVVWDDQQDTFYQNTTWATSITEACDEVAALADTALSSADPADCVCIAVYDKSTQALLNTIGTDPRA